MHLFPPFLLAGRPATLDPVQAPPAETPAEIHVETPAETHPGPLVLHGRPTIGIPGRAAHELRSGAPTAPFDRPDLALVERELAGARVLGASARGVHHKFRGQPRQDAFGVAVREESLIVVVADGVGEFERSHVAADLLVGVLCAGLAEGGDLEALVAAANAELFALAADGTGPLASTLLVAEARRLDTGALAVDLAWVGDPYAFALRDGVWSQLNSFDSYDDAFASTASSALPAAVPDLRRSSTEIEADALFFMTDGVGTPLGSITAVRETLAAWWTEPPTVYEFAAQVEFARRGHMDDRTVVGLWPGHPDLAS